MVTNIFFLHEHGKCDFVFNEHTYGETIKRHNRRSEKPCSDNVRKTCSKCSQFRLQSLFIFIVFNTSTTISLSLSLSLSLCACVRGRARVCVRACVCVSSQIYVASNSNMTFVFLWDAAVLLQIRKWKQMLAF